MSTDKEERIARALCAARGWAADEIIGHSLPGSGMWHYSPRWKVVAWQEVEPFLQLLAAVESDRHVQ